MSPFFFLQIIKSIVKIYETGDPNFGFAKIIGRLKLGFHQNRMTKTVFKPKNHSLTRQDDA